MVSVEHNKGPFAGRTLLAFAVFAILSVGVRVAATGHLGAGLGVVVVLGGLLSLLRWWERARARTQLASMEGTDRFDIQAGLDFSCLPGEWPVMARETLHAAGAAKVAMLPIRLATSNGVLHVTKRRSWWYGHRPFHAEVVLAEISSVAAGPSEFGNVGSSLTIELSHGAVLRVHLPLSRPRAEATAAQLRYGLAGRALPPPGPPRGIVVTTEPPPRRTSPTRALALLALAVLPLPLALAAAAEGPVAAWSSVLSLLFGISLQLKRPPTMHRQLGCGLGLTAVGFAIDTATSADVWRLLGTVICLGLGWWLSLMKSPSW